MWLFYLLILGALWAFSGAADEQLAKAFAEKPKDCAEVQRGGQTKSGIYKIYPRLKTEGVRVYCDLATKGGGWTVFQRRMDGSEDFFVGWNDYRRGFGHPKLGEYWLGLDYIHWITRQLKYELRVELEDWSRSRRYAEYDRFYIEGAGSQFKLYVSGYHGNAGDSLLGHSGEMFTTKDRDNDRNSGNCALIFHGAWWYGDCHVSNLNGLYYVGGRCPYGRGMVWYSWKGQYESMKRTEMKLRPVNFHQ